MIASFGDVIIVCSSRSSCASVFGSVRSVSRRSRRWICKRVLIGLAVMVFV